MRDARGVHRPTWEPTVLRIAAAALRVTPVICALILALITIESRSLAAQTTNTAPSVSANALSGDTIARKSISNAYCDDHGLDSYSQKVFWNSTDVTTSFPWVDGSPYYNCAYAASSKGEVWATLGLNKLEARVCDVMNVSYSPSGPLCTSTVTYLRYRNVDVTPDQAAANKSPNRTQQYFDFIVRRPGNGSGPTEGPNTFALKATCTGHVSGCSVTDSVTTSTQATVRVTFTTGAPDSMGTVTLRATTSGIPESYDEGSVTITNKHPKVLSVNVAQSNNDNQALGACAADCFAATAVASTAPYVSLDVPRSVALVYHGDRVALRPFVQADVSLAAGADQLRQLKLEVKQPSGQSITFLNGESVLTFAPGAAMTQAVRLAGQFDATTNAMGATGIYPVSIIVTATFDDHQEQQTIASKIMIVNERTSPVARGWTIAGVQRIYEQTSSDSSVLITEGDGSAVHFARSGSAYVAPAGEFTRLAVSGVGADRKWVRASPDSTKWQFNYLGELEYVTDRRGNRINYGYLNGRLDVIYDPFRKVGGVLVYTKLRYGTYGLYQVEEPGLNGSLNGGRVTTFTVEADATLRVVQDPDGGQTAYGYDGDLRLTSVTDRRNATVTYVYRNDASWKLAGTRSPVVRIDVGAGLTRDSTLVTKLDAWQTVGVPTSLTNEAPATPVNSADVEGVTTDPAGHVTRFTVDRWGQPLRVTDAVGNVTRTIRNADGLPTQITSPVGTTDAYTYSGAFVSTATPSGQPTTYFEYGPYGQLSKTYGNGPLIEHFIGTQGRIDSTKVGGQFRTNYIYDSLGRLTKVVDPQSHTTQFGYDPVSGNRDSVRTHDGNGFKIRFDRYGRDSVRTALGGGTVTKIYDAMNRLVQQFDGLNASPTTLVYDLDQPARVTDPKGQLYKVAYNLLGWPVTIHDAADTTRYVSLTYSPDGLVASRTNREGRRVDVTYDAIHRLKSRTDPLAGSATFDYDAPGLRVVGQSRDRSGALIAMDSTFIAVSGWTDSVATWLNGQRFRRVYRKWGRGQLDSLGIASSAGIDFYSRRWYINPTTGMPDSLGLGAKRVKLTHNGDGQRTITDWGSGISRTESWTAEHRPAAASFSAGALDDAFNRGFAYDKQGRISQESRYYNSTSANPVDLHRYFAYDTLGEMRWVRRDSVEWRQECYYDNEYEICNWVQDTYTKRRLGLAYDEASNLRQQNDSLTGAVINATLDWGNRLRNWDGVGYSFDRDGNIVARTAPAGTTTFGWGGQGQLLWAALGSDTTYFDYDASGQLVRKRKSGSVIDRWFLWDNGQLLAELNSTATNRLAEYAYDAGVDRPLALITGVTGASALHLYQQSRHGNVDGLFNTAGAVEQRLDYDEWGRLEAYSSSIADSTRLRWKGLYYEGGPTGLYYARARWYDPHARRFISEDPIGLAGGINPYVFGGNDPINMSDPSGLDLAPVVITGRYTPYIPYPNLILWSPHGQEQLNIYRRQEELAVGRQQYQYGGPGGTTPPVVVDRAACAQAIAVAALGVAADVTTFGAGRAALAGARVGIRFARKADYRARLGTSAYLENLAAGTSNAGWSLARLNGARYVAGQAAVTPLEQLVTFATSEDVLSLVPIVGSIMDIRNAARACTAN